LRPPSPAHLKLRASQAKGLAQMVDQLVRSLMRGLSRDHGRLRGLVSQRDLARALGDGRSRNRYI
jgi:CBS domain-containing protein